MTSRRPGASDVFLNLPYDPAFTDLLLAYVAGITAIGLDPRTTLEIPGGERRLDRILELIGSCRYSIHDLSLLRVHARQPAVPHMNMAFELGLTVAWDRVHRGEHRWFVFETTPRRLQTALSDLSGTDIHVHGGQTTGVFRELCNAFVRPPNPPDVRHMKTIYSNLRLGLPDILRRTGARRVFTPSVFENLKTLAVAIRDEIQPPGRHRTAS